jgi:hypothetical protein
MVGEAAATIAVAPAELGEALSAVRLCAPEAQQEMQLSLARLGQLTPVQVYRAGKGLELFDGFKRARAARQLSWSAVRAEVHVLDAAGAKVRLLRCNAGAGLSELEEAWLVRSLYRDDALTQPQIAVLLGRHKSFVCRRLTLAEGGSPTGSRPACDWGSCRRPRRWSWAGCSAATRTWWRTRWRGGG